MTTKGNYLAYKGKTMELSFQSGGDEEGKFLEIKMQPYDNLGGFYKFVLGESEYAELKEFIKNL